MKRKRKKKSIYMYKYTEKIRKTRGFLFYIANLKPSLFQLFFFLFFLVLNFNLNLLFLPT